MVCVGLHRYLHGSVGVTVHEEWCIVSGVGSDADAGGVWENGILFTEDLQFGGFAF